LQWASVPSVTHRFRPGHHVCPYAHPHRLRSVRENRRSRWQTSGLWHWRSAVHVLRNGRPRRGLLAAASSNPATTAPVPTSAPSAAVSAPRRLDPRLSNRDRSSKRFPSIFQPSLADPLKRATSDKQARLFSIRYRSLARTFKRGRERGRQVATARANMRRVGGYLPVATTTNGATAAVAPSIRDMDDATRYLKQPPSAGA
jgi:hypothetical protein